MIRIAFVTKGYEKRYKATMGGITASAGKRAAGGWWATTYDKAANRGVWCCARTSREALAFALLYTAALAKRGSTP